MGTPQKVTLINMHAVLTKLLSLEKSLALLVTTIAVLLLAPVWIGPLVGISIGKAYLALGIYWLFSTLVEFGLKAYANRLLKQRRELLEAQVYARALARMAGGDSNGRR